MMLLSMLRQELDGVCVCYWNYLYCNAAVRLVVG